MRVERLKDDDGYHRVVDKSGNILSYGFFKKNEILTILKIIFKLPLSFFLTKNLLKKI